MSAEQVKSLYASMPDRLATARRTFARPLTLSEKILVASMTRDQIAWFRAGSALNAGQVIDPSTGAAAEMQDVTLEPHDTKAKPGKDV